MNYKMWIIIKDQIKCKFRAIKTIEDDYFRIKSELINGLHGVDSTS